MSRLPLAVLAGFVTFALEVAVFVGAVRLVGLGWALGALLAVSVVGGWLVPRQGVRAWRRFSAAVESGRPPGRQATDGLVGLIGALLMAVPGFVTGVVGALLLVPPLRWVARDALERSVERRTSPAVAGDLFGPRRVRVRRGRPGAPAQDSPVQDSPVQDPPTADSPVVPDVPAGPPRAIEGEIVDGPPYPRPPAT
jgi:UPF0716 protein FxsA